MSGRKGDDIFMTNDWWSLQIRPEPDEQKGLNRDPGFKKQADQT